MEKKFEKIKPEEKTRKEFWVAEWKKRIKEGDIEPFERKKLLRLLAQPFVCRIMIILLME